MNKIKHRAMGYSLVLVGVLISIFIFTIIKNKQYILEEKTALHRTSLQSAFDNSYSKIQRDLSTLACDIAKNADIVEAFATKDRQRLYNLALPYFKKAKEEDKVDVSGFIDATGTHFLRLQDPKMYGDNIAAKRPVLAYAIESKKKINTIDVTIYGASIIAIEPIFYKNEFIGFIQTVSKIDRLQKMLDKTSNIKSALAFATDTLNRVLDKKQKSTIDGYNIVSSNDILFYSLPKNFDFVTNRRYDINATEYIIASRALLNYKNEPVAMIMCAFDIEADQKEYRDEIYKLLALSFIMFLIVTVILHYGFVALLNKIQKDAKLTQELNHKLSHQLYTDNLTELPNRNALMRDIDKIEALALINIDNFKEINDFYGHKTGDEVILSLAKFAQSLINIHTMRLYKMPSDELAITIFSKEYIDSLEPLCREILNSLDIKSFDLSGVSLHISATCGLDIKNDTKNALDLLQNADMALKSAKKQRLSIMLYDDSMQIKQSFKHNIELTKKLKEALQENRLTLFYQPIFDSKHNTIVKYEALLRMIEKDGKIVPPMEFLTVAKHSHMYPQLTIFVIQEIFNIMRSTPYNYSINLSIEDILSQEIVRLIKSKLINSGFGRRLTFEILESEGIKNYHEVSKFISEMKSYGCAIAIDDFGSGYSNFVHVLRLDVDYIKIDGSIIKYIDTDTNSQTILLAIVEFSKRLNLKTVAEFVHSKSVMDKCKELGVDFLQGYHLSEPKPMES